MKFRSSSEINKDCIEYYKKQKNKWRNNFHFEAPFGLINDPNGLSYYNGEYYIFFQWNPYGCEHKYKHWGYVTTKDFKKFSIPKVAISPTDWYDKDGCYSGSALVRDGNLELLYTGNVKDENNNRESYQCRAVLSKDEKIEKLGPIIKEIPKGYTAHFRDPYVWEQNGKYYSIYGIQNKELKGRVLLYSSDEFDTWKLEGEIKTNYDNFGYMWECPSLFELDGKDIFVVSPQGLKAEEFKYQNIYQSGYMIGKLNYESLEFKHGEFKELDKGFDFYAPQVFKDNKGRTILIGWMGLPETEDVHPSKVYGWIHSLTMPRELSLKDDRIYQKPIEEIKNLREENVFNLSDIQTDYMEYNDLMSNSYELKLDVDKNTSSDIEIKFMASDEEYTLLKYNFDDEICIIDRSNMLFGDKDARKFKLEGKNNFKIDMFVDKSAVEIYLQDGMEVASIRLYPKDSSCGISVKSNDGKLNINSMNIWKMGEVEYCE
ncbi:glycoside hydrolase family 32 protein [Clostridium sardiniense]|uniref:glycoside hydrolase family 32 protein n=1 Tax=Clostridium sardiniense TaxID=29369 RepID=UPI003D32C654